MNRSWNANLCLTAAVVLTSLTVEAALKLEVGKPEESTIGYIVTPMKLCNTSNAPTQVQLGKETSHTGHMVADREGVRAVTTWFGDKGQMDKYPFGSEAGRGVNVLDLSPKSCSPEWNVAWGINQSFPGTPIEFRVGLSGISVSNDFPIRNAVSDTV